jgi:hypothetical protein
MIARLLAWLRTKRVKRNRTWLIVNTPIPTRHKVTNNASVDVSKRIQSEWTRWRL